MILRCQTYKMKLPLKLWLGFRKTGTITRCICSFSNYLRVSSVPGTPQAHKVSASMELTFMFMGDHTAGWSQQEPKLPSLKETIGGFKDVWKCKWQKLYVCWYSNEWKHVFSKHIRIEFRCSNERKRFVMLPTQAPLGVLGMWREVGAREILCTENIRGS